MINTIVFDYLNNNSPIELTVNSIIDLIPENHGTKSAIRKKIYKALREFGYEPYKKYSPRWVKQEEDAIADVKPKEPINLGFELNKEQQEYVECLADYENRRGQIVTVTGSAGSGKSTANVEGLKCIGNAHIKIITPTHAAIDVCKNMIEKTGLTNRIEYQTLASLLHCRPVIDKETCKIEYHPGIIKPPADGEVPDILWLDEFSMVSEHQMKALYKHALSINSALYTSGDVNQLPPINGLSCFDWLKAEGELIELTKVQRQSGDLLDFIDQHKNVKISDLSYKKLKSKVTGESVTVLNASSPLIDIASKHGSDIDSFISLAYTKATAKDNGRIIRKAIRPDLIGNFKQLHPNDKIVLNKPSYAIDVLGLPISQKLIHFATTGYEQPQANNGAKFIVIEAREPVTERFSLDEFEYDLLDELISISSTVKGTFKKKIFSKGRVSFEEHDAKTIFAKAMKGLTDVFEITHQECLVESPSGLRIWLDIPDHRKSTKSIERLVDSAASALVIANTNGAITDAEYDEMSNYVVALQKFVDWGTTLSYARTIHKSQGCTIPYVYVDLTDIKLSKRLSKMPDLNKAIYTAFSRASKHLYIRA